ncbi:MAG: type II toxin-antitoxin system RelE/ParE family toxin [Chloroflexi bacterium]|nr:MAG: type II toxin-antitoxin system RelE/ParE family toxin [Chloroflexota bacterium]
MPNEIDWVIEFYLRDDGSSPVREFLESLGDKTQARFLVSIEQLRARNIQAREPLVKHIEGKLWELRRTSDGNIYRLFYFFFTGRRIVFVHGFQKKTGKTPKHEIDIAKARMKDYLARRDPD